MGRAPADESTAETNRDTAWLVPAHRWADRCAIRRASEVLMRVLYDVVFFIFHISGAAVRVVVILADEDAI